MSELFASLLQGMGRSNPYSQMLYSAQESPFSQAAVGLSQASQGLYNPYKSTGSNLATAGLSGLASAILAGIGTNMTESKNAELIKQAAAMEGVEGDDRRAMVEANPRLAPLYGQLAAQEKEAEKARLKAEMEAPTTKEFKVGNEIVTKQYVPGQGWTEVGRAARWDPSGGAVGKLASAIAAQHVDGLGELPAELQSKAAQADSLAAQMSDIASRIEKSKATYGELKGGDFLSALDKQGIATDLKNLTDRYVRSRSGAAVRDEEMQVGKQILSGDLSSGPEQVSKFLRSAARNELEYVKNIYQHGQQRTSNPSGYLNSLNSRIKQLSGRPGYGSDGQSDFAVGGTYNGEKILKVEKIQ